MPSRKQYFDLVRKLKQIGYEKEYSIADDCGTGGVYFYNAGLDSQICINKDSFAQWETYLNTLDLANWK